MSEYTKPTSGKTDKKRSIMLDAVYPLSSKDPLRPPYTKKLITISTISMIPKKIPKVISDLKGFNSFKCKDRIVKATAITQQASRKQPKNANR